MPSAASLLFDILSPRLSARGRDWVGRVDEAAGADALRLLASAGRAVGKLPVSLRPDERGRVRAAGVEWLFTAGVPADEVARVATIVAACEGAKGAGDAGATAVSGLVAECYRQGDTGEKRAVLRALALLSPPVGDALLEVAAQACRSNIQDVFESICCENPFPADRFADPAFHRMVLKALSVGVALDRIVGLDRRVTAELGRMAADHASERRAAGRPVPADIGRLVTRGDVR